MVERRQILAVLASACALTPVIWWLSGPSTDSTVAESFPVQKSDDEWRRTLTPAQYQTLRHHDTERPYTSPLNHETRTGIFHCAACGHDLFASNTKFESGTGWPSFYRPLESAIATRVDRTLLMVRIEVHCASCGGHLGHVFEDGPAPTGLRYCMNGVALAFAPEA